MVREIEARHRALSSSLMVAIEPAGHRVIYFAQNFSELVATLV